jgi:Putative transposase
VVYEILFRATAGTLLTIAADPQRLGVNLGFFCVLHSWGQNLHFHPHLHCVVPGGGLSADHERWISGRRRFLLPVKVLSRLFRRLFLEALEKAYASGKLQFFGDLEPLRDAPAFTHYLAPLQKAQWVVYAKAPFGGPPTRHPVSRPLHPSRGHLQPSSVGSGKRPGLFRLEGLPRWRPR